MTLRDATTSRPFEPGTTGWTASDLDDPEIESLWEAGRFEIINGVLSTMPPACFDHGAPVSELAILLAAHLRAEGASVRFAPEVDLILDEDRLLETDLVMMTAEDTRREVLPNAYPGLVIRLTDLWGCND